MRALVAVVLSLGLILAAGVPHVHPPDHPGSECAVCVARHGDVAHDETPDVAPRALHAEPVVVLPTPPPVTGAPLGAVPGQSPPAVA